jgi:hypothetical protein
MLVRQIEKQAEWKFSTKSGSRKGNLWLSTRLMKHSKRWGLWKADDSDGGYAFREALKDRDARNLEVEVELSKNTPVVFAARSSGARLSGLQSI